MLVAASDKMNNASGGGPMSSSEELVTRIAAAQRPLFAYIRTLVGPKEDVADILQEVNLVIWRRGHEFEDGQGQFLAWACHIAYLQVLAHCQKRRREKHVFFDEHVLTDLAGLVSREVERIDARLDALHGCLAKLTPAQRRMILSRYEDGGSVQKVALELDRPVGSVRVTLHRVRQLLADCVGRTLAPGECV
jgi:RNA polymerase sigma-70 factor (ECF subfamily)